MKEPRINGVPFSEATGDPIETWAGRLPPSYASMFKAIARSATGLGRDEIAAEAGISPTSSGLGLRELLALDLIVKTGSTYFLAEALS